MERYANSLSLPKATGKKIYKVAGKIVSVMMLTLMSVLVFFLLQSRIAGGAPSIAGYQLYIVLSGSMSPAFETGSVVLVRPLAPSAVQPGDIITYRDPDPEKADTIVTHRVMAVLPTEPLSFTTRGDANNANDLIPIPASNLLGRVNYSVPLLGYLLSFVRTGAGILLMVIVPALLIVVSELRRFISYAAAFEKEKKGGALQR